VRVCPARSFDSRAAGAPGTAIAPGGEIARSVRSLKSVVVWSRLMSRLGFHHIAWSKTEPARHRFDLADSSVATPDLAALGLPHQTSLPKDGYAHALPALERALAARVSAPGGRVLVTAGASEANACVCGGLLSAGDEVLVECPGYEPHRALVPLFGATLRRFTRARERAYAGFAPAVEASLSSATRLVVVSHLHNPSGVLLEEADVEVLDRLAERHDFHVLCDETFRDTAGGRLCTLAGRGPRWVCTSSLTKSYGLGGLRIGWIAGNGEALERCAAAQNGLSVNPALPSVALALALAPHLDRLLERSHRLLAQNHARWSAFAERCRAAGGSAGFDPGVPSLGTTAWCLFSAEPGGDAFAEFASRRFDLALTPGRFFGEPRGVRVGLGSEPERFTGALAQLERALMEFVEVGTRSGAIA